MPEKKPWPYNTPEDLKEAGYKLSGSGRCRGQNCGAMIEWWKTPQDHNIPIDPDTMQPHWATCPNSKSFKR